MKQYGKYVAMMACVALFTTACKEDDTPPPSSGDNKTTFTEAFVRDGDGNVIETVITIDDKGQGIGTKTLTADKTWVLDGLVFVNAGQTLTIEPGTVVKGESGNGENASALVVARGATIIADGTAAKPIIFTSSADQIYRDSDGNLQGSGNLNAEVRGLWGGVIVLGSAELNSSPGETAIEGIPTTETRGLYGGSNDADNSGVLRYISIRHGGTDIGAGNEINGLTLGGVGNGTTIEHIEVIANADDGIEWFGGTANVKYAAVVNCGDDGFDYDEGWRGALQFGFVYHPGGDGGEHDGGTDPEDGTPYATPRFANVTSISIATDNRMVLNMRDNAGGEYHNSIFVEYGAGIMIEDLAAGEDSRARLESGDLKIMNNIFWNVAGNDAMLTINSTTGEDLWNNHANITGNVISDPGLTLGVPSAAGTAVWGAGFDPFFNTTVTYKGAFDPAASSTWLSGWTKTDAEGVIQ